MNSSALPAATMPLVGGVPTGSFALKVFSQAAVATLVLLGDAPAPPIDGSELDVAELELLPIHGVGAIQSQATTESLNADELVRPSVHKLIRRTFAVRGDIAEPD